jgi:hypothetical protein
MFKQRTGLENFELYRLFSDNIYKCRKIVANAVLSVIHICSDNCALQKPVQAFRGLIFLSCYPVETCVDQKFLKHFVFIALSAAVKKTSPFT